MSKWDLSKVTLETIENASGQELNELAALSMGWMIHPRNTALWCSKNTNKTYYDNEYMYHGTVHSGSLNHFRPAYNEDYAAMVRNFVFEHKKQNAYKKFLFYFLPNVDSDISPSDAILNSSSEQITKASIAALLGLVVPNTDMEYAEENNKEDLLFELKNELYVMCSRNPGNVPMMVEYEKVRAEYNAIATQRTRY